MIAAVDNILEVDLHRLQLRFAQTRLTEPRAVEQLARSIEQCGQVVPCMVVPDNEDQAQLQSWVLVDGYRRVAALKRLGRDTAQIRVWPCAVSDGLLQMLAQTHARPLDPIEEALLLRELMDGQGITQPEIARRIGKDVSWVNRRLGLLSGMPQECLAAVRDGTISCWAATRVLAPLARANAAHATSLLKSIVAESLPTRDLARWYDHYQKATRAVRDRMVERPGLFLTALQAREEELQLEELRKGPEGQCLKDLRAVDAIVARVRQRLTELSGQEISSDLIEMLRRLRARLVSWCNDLQRYEHDRSTDPQCGDNAVPPGQGVVAHQPRTEAVKEHR
jgi:ParB family transcriptional regulator, chromosome partitioning protein